MENTLSPQALSSQGYDTVISPYDRTVILPEAMQSEIGNYTNQSSIRGHTAPGTARSSSGGDYQDLISGMRSQIQHMKGRMGLNEDINLHSPGEMPLSPQGAQYRGRPTIAIEEVDEDISVVSDPIRQMSELRGPNALGPSLGCSYSAVNFGNFPADSNQNIQDSNNFSMSRQALSQMNFNSIHNSQHISDMNYNVNSRGPLTTTKKNVVGPIRTSILGSPLSPSHLANSKENLCNNSPQNEAAGVLIQHKYDDQVNLNRQLIDQVKALQRKLMTQEQNSQMQIDLKLIKSLENEEYLKDKVKNQQTEIQGLRIRNSEMNMHIEESMRSNHEMESYVENCEANAQSFTQRQQQFNKKIQELNHKIVSLTQQNQDIEAKLKQTECDKTKLSEKWVRLSARQKVEEKKNRKDKEKESECQKILNEYTVLKEKVDVVERENKFLRESEAASKEKLGKQGDELRDATSERDTLVKEKKLADTVTNELLQRIQTNEGEVNKLRQENKQLGESLRVSQAEADDVRMIEQEMRGMQQRMDDMARHGQDLQLYSQQLETDNERMVRELQQTQRDGQIKDQEIESLRLQLDHQASELKEMEGEFQEIVNKANRSINGSQIRFLKQELTDAATYLLEEVCKDGNLCFNDDNEKCSMDTTINSNPNMFLMDNESFNPRRVSTPAFSEEEAKHLGALTLKSAGRIRFLNKYIESLKSELEETQEKYDRMAIKLREKSVGSEHTEDKAQMLKEIEELRNYVGELETIIKGQTSTVPGLNTADGVFDFNTRNFGITSNESQPEQFIQTFRATNLDLGSLQSPQNYVSDSYPISVVNQGDMNQIQGYSQANGTNGNHFMFQTESSIGNAEQQCSFNNNDQAQYANKRSIERSNPCYDTYQNQTDTDYDSSQQSAQDRFLQRVAVNRVNYDTNQKLPKTIHHQPFNHIAQPSQVPSYFSNGDHSVRSSNVCLPTRFYNSNANPIRQSVQMSSTNLHTYQPSQDSCTMNDYTTAMQLRGGMAYEKMSHSTDTLHCNQLGRSVAVTSDHNGSLQEQIRKELEMKKPKSMALNILRNSCTDLRSNETSSGIVGHKSARGGQYQAKPGTVFAPLSQRNKNAHARNARPTSLQMRKATN